MELAIGLSRGASFRLWIPRSETWKKRKTVWRASSLFACIANMVRLRICSVYHQRGFTIHLGVVKTHKLPLHTIESAHQFTDNPGEDESYITIGPKMLKDIIEHFPSVRGNKGDPQLVWGFSDSEVIIRSMETSLDTRGEPKTTMARSCSTHYL